MGAFNIPLKSDGTAITVVIPSDIAIVVNQILDENGEKVLFEENYFKFVFSDKDGTEVECIHDPSGINSKNTAYYQEEDYLRLLVPTTDFVKGWMYCKCFTRVADSDFDDGYWDVCTRKERINLKLIE